MEIYVERIPNNPLCVNIQIVPQVIENSFLKNEFLRSIEKKVADLIIKHDTDYSELKKYSLGLVKDNKRLELDRNSQSFMAKQFQNKLIELMGFDDFLKFEKVCFAFMKQQNWYLDKEQRK